MILLTGGAGYIGSHVNKYLNKNGCKTIIFDNLENGHRSNVKWGKFVEGDLRNYNDIQKLFEDNEISGVIHFASYAYVGESMENPQKYYHNNVVGTINLLRAMLENDVKNIVFSSTCATYGMPNSLPIREDHIQNPINPYGASKLMIERILKDYHMIGKINYVALRYFNAAGADPDGEIGENHHPETHLIPLVLDAAIGRRENIKVFGDDYDTVDGTCIRDYIHVFDLAQAHLKALNYIIQNGGSEVFNLGNGSGYSVKEIIETVKSITGKEFDVIIESRRPGDPDSLVGSAEKAKRILGWSPKYHDISDIISTAWNWHKKLYGIEV